MALPSGTSGWVGSGFDCGCACSFSGGFDYSNDQCLLTFYVDNMKSGCDVILASDADITIEITGPSGVETGVTANSGNTGFGWTRFKPQAGFTYTATVTLDCGSDTITSEFEITIPNPANTACNCCTERTPDYATLSGLVSCCAWANGTYALDPVGSCVYEYSSSTAGELQTDPGAGAGCSAGYCGTFTIGSDTWYLWPRGIVITVTMPGVTGLVTITLIIQFYGYRLRAGVCTYQRAPTVTYTFQRSCDTGEATLLTTSFSDINNCGTPPVFNLFVA